jgi:hypothetical protein
MPSSFPVPPVLMLQYFVQTSPLSNGLASVPVSAMELVQFGFHAPADYAQFDQAAVEAGLAAMLNSVCTSLAAITGLTAAVVQASVIVNRVWSFGDPGSPTVVHTWTDQMKYP